MGQKPLGVAHILQAREPGERAIQKTSGKKDQGNRRGFISATGQYVSDAQLAREISAAHRAFFAKRGCIPNQQFNA
jgi:hypothetical protein